MQSALVNPQQAYAWWLQAWQTIKPLLIAGNRLHVEVRPEKRSDPQDRMLHSIFGDFARSRIPFAGKPRTADQWKVLLISGHATATKHGS